MTSQASLFSYKPLPTCFSTISALREQETGTGHSCNIPCNAPAFLLLILRIPRLDTFITGRNTTSDLTKKMNSRMMCIVSVFCLLGETPRALYKNMHVHALRKGPLTFFFKFLSLSSRNCTLFYIVMTHDIL